MTCLPEESISSPQMMPPNIEESILVARNASAEKPRRNLTQAFEALLVNDESEGVGIQQFNSVDSSIILPSYQSVQLSEKLQLVSPTSVVNFGHPVHDHSDKLHQEPPVFPELLLHKDLRRELSLHCVRRVSCYCIIHDINKECTSMAQHDPLFNAATEKDSPLVVAALGLADESDGTINLLDPSKVAFAIIDEEKWLLSAIAGRTAQETHLITNSDCPSTFLQAIGEKEYENPVQSVTGHSRTQLWKPSRSWWEAKSGKNPWIEPSSHNKRWRYLWPLIHYHKFLAKCIKKLKRNGVDVKIAISPVSVFLREEVCAVSDHLAAVSLFDSDEWMACLQHFDGWTVITSAAENMYRAFIQHLPLRGLTEQGDVESPILRSQIDENFLRAMVAQREQFRETNVTVSASSTNQTSHEKFSTDRATSDIINDGETPLEITGQPQLYTQMSPQQNGIPRHISGVRRPRYFQQAGGWYSWEGQPFHDNSSVHSELSANSFPQQQQRFDFNGSSLGVYSVPPPGHLPTGYYAPVSAFPGSTDQSLSSDGYTFVNTSYHDPSMAWGNPYMGTNFMVPQQQTMDAYYGHHMAMNQAMHSPSVGYTFQQTNTTDFLMSLNSSAVSQSNIQTSEETPVKYDQDSNYTRSPYWSHLDQATIAMGLATPAKPPTPITPSKKFDEKEKDTPSFVKESTAFTSVAQAPLIRQHYYPIGNYHMHGANGFRSQGFVPPSPATQFMMSPHAHTNANFGYNYSYGFSPRRNVRTSVTPKSMSTKSIPEKGTTSSPSAGTHLGSTKLDQRLERHSPSTVETSTDSESGIENVSSLA